VFRCFRAIRTTRKQLSMCCPMNSPFGQSCLNLGFLAVDYKWLILLRMVWTWLSTDEISVNFWYLVCSGHGDLNLAKHQHASERASTSAGSATNMTTKLCWLAACYWIRQIARRDISIVVCGCRWSCNHGRMEIPAAILSILLASGRILNSQLH
jgi:hypothetical protein